MTAHGARPRTGRAALRALAVCAVLAAVAPGGLAAGTAHAQAAPGPVAAAPAAPAGTGEAEAVLTAAAARAREEVRRIALSGLPAELRTSAWHALRQVGGDEVITTWMGPGGGYEAAKQRLRDTRTRNRLFCERVVRTHPVSFAPATRAAAERALKGSDADRAAFVKTGYAQAQLADRTARETAATEQQAVRERDREFVRTVAERDPGEQVRASAQWALRPAATDADVREFYGFGWVTGAAVDLEGHRMRNADSEVLRHRSLTLLVGAAVEAEEGLRTASDPTAARAEVRRAWQAVAGQARTADAAWRAERDHAVRQADTWKGVRVLASAAPEEMWKRLAAPAGDNEQSWSKEGQEAAGAAAFWQEILRQALQGEARSGD
ncbi:ALF repeat-containing protein [Streptomyces sp. bgisy095]|uniref:ALF repeat-containing protein n=1 Tax=unclassified Streptomyces TaxID=2593676 RepID=UPI003D7474B2